MDKKPDKDEYLRPTEKSRRKRKSNIEDTDDEDEPDKKEMAKSFVVELLKKDIPIAILILVIIIGSLFAYTQNWPPMVVVESRSMMHDEDSGIGVIDTGDLVLVKKINSRSEVTTYTEAKDDDYETYGTPGDVIIYKKNGGGDTPVIHRAVCWIEFNDTTFNYNHTTGYWTGGAFDIPELNAYGLTGSFSIPDYGHNKINLMIDFRTIIDNFANQTIPNTGRRLGFRSYPHSGFLTKGDSDENSMCDQNSLRSGGSTVFVEPIKVDWIVGKAEGELPWFGLIKLYMSSQITKDNPAPPSSINGLIISLVLIIAIPLSLDIIVSRREKKKAMQEEEDEDEEFKGKKRKDRKLPKSTVPEKKGPRVSSKLVLNKEELSSENSKRRSTNKKEKNGKK
jgi:signal peptidase